MSLSVQAPDAREAHDAWVGLGANLADPQASLDSALRALAALPLTVLIRVSSRYRSAPLQAEGPDFINAVALLRTGLAPLDLLDHLQAIESDHGRERPYPNAPRTLDLDLLLHGGAGSGSPHTSARLTLPHPRLHQRAFVLAPLAELDATLAIPGRGSVAELLRTCTDQRCVRLPARADPT